MTEKSGVEVCELLPGEFGRFDETLKKAAVGENGARPGIPDFVWKMVASQAQQDMHDALGVDVFSLVARGWCLAQELHQYTDKEKYPPEQTSIVFLAEHTTTTDVHPVLKLSVGEISCRPLRFTVALAANFRSAALLIKGGYIIGVGTGDCDVSAQLKYGDIALHKPLESRHLVIPGRKLFDAPGLAIG